MSGATASPIAAWMAVRRFRTLNSLDETGRECLATMGDQKRNATNVMDTLNGLLILRGVPVLIWSDNGSEFFA
jgi:hypothetical protein